MARRKSKKQKKQTDARTRSANLVKKSGSSSYSSEEEINLPVLDTNSKKSKTTVFSETQVKLLYKDLFKTLIVTLVVFIVLLSIFVYMR